MGLSFSSEDKNMGKCVGLTRSPAVARLRRIYKRDSATLRFPQDDILGEVHCGAEILHSFLVQNDRIGLG